MRLTAPRRRGGILPLVAVSIVALVALVAMAIDVGLLAVARNECQAAADAAALPGARPLTGDPATDYNRGAAAGNAEKAALLNSVLGTPLQDSQVTIQIGSYRYDTTQDRFIIDPTGRNPGDAW